MPEARSGHVILGVNVLVLGYLPAAWQWDPRLTRAIALDPAYWQHIGVVAERGTLDALFLADGPALGNPFYDANTAKLEPTVNWFHLAAATEHIGLIATASTTFNDPFELAERLASFDYASRGRAGWNAVTTRQGQAAGNFGLTGCPSADGTRRRPPGLPFHAAGAVAGPAVPAGSSGAAPGGRFRPGAVARGNPGGGRLRRGTDQGRRH